MTDVENQPAPIQPDSTWTIHRRQVISAIITLAALAVVLVGIVPQFADQDQAWASITTMPLGWVIGLALSAVVLVLIYVPPYQAALPELGYGPAFVVRQTAFMISNAIPAGGAFSLALQYTMLGGYEIGTAPASTGILVTSVWNQFVTLTLPVAAVLALVLTGGMTAGAGLAAAAGVGALVALLMGFRLVLRSEETARRVGQLGDRLVGWALRRIHKVHDLGLAEGVVSFRRSTIDVIRARWVSITVTNVLVQLSQFAVLFIGLSAVQRGAADKVTLVETFVAFAFARLLTYVPLTPGGLGMVDAALVWLLGHFGATSEVALAADLVWRAASYFPQVLLGIITFVVWRRHHAGQPSPPR